MRHFSRHLEATIQNLVHDHLVTTGWLPAPNQVGFETLFGAKPVVFQRDRLDESTLTAVEPNLVAVSFGNQSDDVPQEVGGGLITQEHVVFVDVIAENLGIALALAEDVRDLMVGKTVAGRYFRIVDQVTTTLVAGAYGHWFEVFREPADRELANARWQTLRATVEVHMPGSDY